MKNSRTKFVGLLESKKRYIEDMEKILIEQKGFLDNEEFDRFRRNSDNVDDIIGKIKNIDYDIARLESDDVSISGMINSGDDHIKKIVASLIKITKRNHNLMTELTDVLKKSYHKLGDELGETVEMSKIGGYKAVTRPSPVYFDKTS